MPVSKIFFHIIPQSARFSKQPYWTRSVFDFCLQILSETLIILRTIEQDVIKMYIGVYVKYPLFFPDFKEN